MTLHVARFVILEQIMSHFRLIASSGYGLLTLVLKDRRCIQVFDYLVPYILRLLYYV